MILLPELLVAKILYWVAALLGLVAMAGLLGLLIDIADEALHGPRSHDDD